MAVRSARTLGALVVLGLAVSSCADDDAEPADRRRSRRGRDHDRPARICRRRRSPHRPSRPRSADGCGLRVLRCSTSSGSCSRKPSRSVCRRMRRWHRSIPSATSGPVRGRSAARTGPRISGSLRSDPDSTNSWASASSQGVSRLCVASQARGALWLACLEDAGQSFSLDDPELTQLVDALSAALSRAWVRRTRSGFRAVGAPGPARPERSVPPPDPPSARWLRVDLRR